MRKIMVILVLLFLTSFGFADKVADLPAVLKPSVIITDGQSFFFSQDYSVYNYSLKTFKEVAKFVSKGQGPGEIAEDPPYLALYSDLILVYSDGKCLWYTKDGKLQRELKIPRENVEILPAKDGYISSRFFPDEKEQHVYIKFFLLDSKFESKTQLYQTVYDVNVSWGAQREAGFKNFKMITYFVGVGYQDEKIFIGDSSKGFFIDVYDLNGKHLYTIQKDDEVKKIEIDEDYKKKLLDEFRVVAPNVWPYVKDNNYVFYKHFPQIRNFFVADGKIYVLTFKKENDRYEMIVLDLKGKILKRLLLPFKGMRYYVRPGLRDTLTVKNGKVYELVENLDTEMYELHTYQIE